MVEKLKKYIKKYWLTQISRDNLSIFELCISTDNGAEINHSKHRARIRSAHLSYGHFCQPKQHHCRHTMTSVK